MRRAFTVVELVVCVAIIGVISLIVVSGQNNFNQSLLLTDTAYTMALSIREAQSLGIGSRSAGGVYNTGYGVHVSLGAPTNYIVFADTATTQSTPSYCPVLSTPAGSPQTKTGNCLYDGSSETTQTYKFNNGFKIGKVCGKDTLSNYVCSNTGSLTALDILFLRPNTTAVLSAFENGAPTQLSCAEIYISSPTGSVTRPIRVNSLGEVSVSQICP